jgi:conjugative transfer signal peptidase TraF
MSRAVSHMPPMRRRSLPVVMLLTGAMTMGAIAAACAGGVRINATASMPRGLWQVQAGEPIERGAVVAICPPDRADIRQAARRGYIPAGGCTGGYEPLVKPIAARRATW